MNNIDTKAPKDAQEQLKKSVVPTRRVKMLMVNPADFMFLFTKGLIFRKNTRLIKGIPDDAKLIAVAGDSARNGIMLVVESSKYNPVPINVLPPVESVEIQTGENPNTKKKTIRKK